jgi:hypothetical protein
MDEMILRLNNVDRAWGVVVDEGCKEAVLRVSE